MREQDHGKYKFFISDDMDFFYKKGGASSFWENNHKKHMEFMFTKRKLFTELFEAWGAANDLKGYKILEAHGDFYRNRWIYSEGHKVVDSVQNWVNEHDGSATALFLTPCNPNESKVTSKHSLVLHASKLTGSFPSMVYTQGLIRVFVPGKGYMEKDYKGLRKLINELNQG